MHDNAYEIQLRDYVPDGLTLEAGIGDLVLDGSTGIKLLERATNITARVGVSEESTRFQVEESATLEASFDVAVRKAFEVEVQTCPD